MNRKIDINKLSSSVIKAAIIAHKERGPGLLESVYQARMEIELKEMNLEIESELSFPINHQIDLFPEPYFSKDHQKNSEPLRTP